MGNTKVVVKEAAQKPKPEVQQPISISSVSATKVNELTVTFANAVGSPSAITFSVKKGNSAVETASTKWSDDKTSVVIKTVAKMTKGTYTVTAKDGETETTGSAEVVAQYVASIEILNTVALTGTHKFSATGGAIEGGECYVYYDVLDQYGDSLRSSTSIEWSTSTAKPTDKRTEGKLILTRSDQKAFTYGEQIYVTGVYGKTGVSVTKTLTIGAKQSLDTVEVIGFAKKGTNTLLTSLPAGFKTGAYYMLFTVKDQNGNAMSVEKDYLASGDTQVTFVSDNVLVVKEIKDGETIVNIDGTDYKAVLVTPGQNVDKGGEVTITAIANKTGKKTECKLVVGNAQILKSFTMSAPDGVVADGETVEIPFVALDQDGKNITAFTTLANQTDFSNLTLNSSEGVLYLEEQNDGTAKLKYADTKKTRWESDSADGIDRPISLTSVVVGGDTSNLMIYVSDKARPDAIKDVDMSSVLVEGGSIKYTLSDFTFLDQYGREIKGFSRDDSHDRFANANRGYVKDNGFFAAAASGNIIGGTDYSGYSFGVKVEYKGNTKYLTTVDAANTLNAANTSAVIKDESGVATGKTLVTSSGAVTASTDNQTVKFTIVKQKTGSQLEEVSTAKTKSFKIVNINKVSSFEIKDLKKQFVGTDASDYANLYLAKGTFDKTTLESAVTLGDGIDKAHTQTVEVVGKFNGESVTIPHGYYTIKGDKMGSAVSGSAIAESAKTEAGHKLTTVTTDASKLAYKDLYDANSASGTRKDTTDTIVATIYSNNGEKLDVAKKTLTISDANPAATTIKAGDAYTYLPTDTKIGSISAGSAGLLNVNVTVTNGDAKYNLPDSEAEKFFTDYGPKGFKVVDQYGVDITDAVEAAGKLTFKVSNAVENASGYADNNFTVNSNDSVNASITGAELGDKFTLTVTADQNGTASKNITITVGADRSAYVSSDAAGNNYKNHLVKDYLEKQRTAGLGN